MRYHIVNKSVAQTGTVILRYSYNAGRTAINDAIKVAGLRGKQGIYWEDVTSKASSETREYVAKILGTKGDVSGYAKEYGYNGE